MLQRKKERYEREVTEKPGEPNFSRPDAERRGQDLKHEQYPFLVQKKSGCKRCESYYGPHLFVGILKYFLGFSFTLTITYLLTSLTNLKLYIISNSHILYDQ